MPELDPASLAERVLRLSRSRPFDQMDRDELALVAAAGREQHIRTRTVLVHAGERAMAHYLPLAGRLRLVSKRGGRATSTSAEIGFGGLSVLGRGSVPEDLVADAGTVLLIIDEDALVALLEEHGHLARAVLRILATRLRQLHQFEPRLPTPAPLSPVRIDLVSRMLLLREALGLGENGTAVVAGLARGARIARFVPGTPVWTRDTPADVVIIVEGALRLARTGGGERRVEAGEALGLLESVAGIAMEEQATALEPTTALVLSQVDLSESIEDDDALSVGLIRSFAARTWTALGASPAPAYE